MWERIKIPFWLEIGFYFLILFAEIVGLMFLIKWLWF